MKRFYRDVSIAHVNGGFQVRLDDRPVLTQDGNAQIVTTQALGELLAGEWRAQGDVIDPQSFRHRDLADYAIDAIAPSPRTVRGQLLSFAETDTLCYRADPEDALFQRQQAEWEPLLGAFERRHDCKMVRMSGIVYRAQDADMMKRLEEQLTTLNPFSLAGVQAMASLCASLVIALLAAEEAFDADTLWKAAFLEEDWQAEQWGLDEEAAARQTRKRSEFMDAFAFTKASIT